MSQQLHPREAMIERNRERALNASLEDMSRAQLAFSTFHPDCELELSSFIERHPTYVCRWIDVAAALDAKGGVA
jgi:hypothetical protein